MKKIILIISLLFCLLAVYGQSVYADELPEDDIFDEVYYNSPGDSLHIVYRYKLIDQEHHIYVSKVGTSFKRTSGNSVSGDVYDETSITNGRTVCAEITGILKSNTAEVIDYKEWGLPEARISITDQKATCLKQDMDTMVYSSAAIGAKDESFIIEKKDDINVFTASGSEISCPSSEVSIFMYQLTVRDQGIDTVCTFIMGTFYDYQYYDDLGKWDRNKGDSDWSSYLENITLYDGTDGRSDPLPELYQYGKRFNWQTGDMIYGLEKTGLLPEEEIEIPSYVKSIRVSYEDDFPEPHSALYIQMPGNHINAQIIDPIQQIHDYYYYRNKTHMVSVDGNHWYEIKAGQVSPELQLKKGLNFVYIIDSDVKRRSSQFDGNKDARDILYHLLVLYWDGEEDYSVTPNQSTRLKDLQIFRAGFDESDSLDGFTSYNIMEETSGNETVRTIDMNSAYPYLWINPVTEAAEATVIVEGSKSFLGGYFVRCDSEKDFFEIKVISENGESEENYRININWTLAAPELKDLSVLNGGSLDEAFSPETRSYYCQKGSLGKIALSYTTSDNVTTKVSVDREQKAVVEGRKQKTLMVDSTAHEIRWDIESPVGKTAVYTMYMDRGEEKGLSDQSRQRAKSMIDKLVSGNYNTYLKQYNGDSYWKTFGAASLGEEYIDGMLAYDVTQHEFKQSSDYAAIILELIMSGENPYDYLGTNYVEKLWEYNDDGNFGPFSCNIWALTALEACGHSIPDKLIDHVKVMAMSEGADLDMRGWALYALSPYRSVFTEKEYARCIQSIKDVQIFSPISVNGIDVTGCFENFWYTNRNANTHACVVSGLIGMGIDIAASEFCGENGADPISVLENYQAENGGWIFTPNNPTANGSYNKDVVVAVGDIYHGANVYTRYYLTEDRYKDLLNQARDLLDNGINDGAKKEHLEEAYGGAVRYASEGNDLSSHGMEYYSLQDAIYDVVPDEKPDVFLGTGEERERVKEVNDLIRTISTYSYSDKDKLDGIKEKYQNLNEERLFHYVIDKDVLDKAYGYIHEVDLFLDQVKAIGNVNLTKTTKVRKARQTYNGLSDKQKAETVIKTALKTLVEAEKIIEQKKTADQVERAIRNLGTVILLENKQDVESVRQAYEALSAKEKGFVTNLSDLERAEQTIRDLEAREGMIIAADEVTDRISDIGMVTRNSGDSVQAARNAYDGLSSEEEELLVGNYSMLLDAEAELANIQERESLDAALSQMDYLINQIFEKMGASADITEEIASDVREALDQAEGYLEEQEGTWPDFRWMVNNYPEMVEVRGKLMLYENPVPDVTSFGEFREAVESIQVTGLEAGINILRAEALSDHLDDPDHMEEITVLRETLAEKKQILTCYQESFEDIKEAVYAICRIGQVNESYTEEYLEAADIYNQMDTDTQQLLPEASLSSIQEAGENFVAIQERKEVLSEVETLITKASTVTSLADKKLVIQARETYDSCDNKEYIQNYRILIKAEEAVRKLEKEQEDSQIAGDVEDIIYSLGSVTLADEDKVEEARRAYDALTDNQKGQVTNLSVLTAAEKKISDLKKKADTDSTSSKTESKNQTKMTVKVSISLLRNKKSSKAYLIGKTTKYKLLLKINGKKIKNSKIKWSSSKKRIASISGGSLLVKKKGKVKITARYSGKKYSVTLTVKKASFKLKKKKVTLKKGKRYQIRYTAVPKAKPKYQSMNKKIVSVSTKGIVAARKKGTAKIKVRANGITRYLKVIVR